MGAEEGILYAQCDLELGIAMKLRHDFAGHYNRPDIFHLQINRTAPKLYAVHGGEEDPALAAAHDAAARIGMSAPSVALSELPGDTGQENKCDK
jgi:aliphatic nitrilase